MEKVYGNLIMHFSMIKYIETINKVIKETKENYAIPVYSRKFNTDIPDNEIQFMISSFLKHYKWKLEVKAFLTPVT